MTLPVGCTPAAAVSRKLVIRMPAPLPAVPSPVVPVMMLRRMVLLLEPSLMPMPAVRMPSIVLFSISAPCVWYQISMPLPSAGFDAGVPE